MSTAYRLRALGTIAASLCQVAAARFDGMVSLRKCRGVDAAAGQLIVREAGGLVSFPGLDDPLAAPLDAQPSAPVIAARTPETLTELERIPAMIDWILAERIAGYVAGTGNGHLPKADLAALAAESEARVIAYTGLTPARPLPKPEGISRKEWVATNVGAMRPLLDPVLERAGEGMGPLRPAMQIGIGFALTTEVGVVLGYLAQRVLGQYELVLLDEAVDDRPPRLLFVLPNLGEAVQAFGAEEQEFMTWVTLHEVTHAVQFAGVPWLHGHVAGLVRELLRAPRCGSTRRASCGCRAATRCGGSRGALRHGDLISLVTNDAERETLDRVQAVMAVIEGHAEHVMDAVAPDLLPVAAEAARGARPPSQVAVGALAPGGRAARPRDEAPPVRAGQVLLRRGRQGRRHRGAAPRVLEPRGAADAGGARASERLDRPHRARAAASRARARARTGATRPGRPQRVQAAILERAARSRRRGP